MATSSYVTSQYTSEQFVESCGAVLFDASGGQPRVCLIHYKHDEWPLPKGRRDCGGSRREAALREVQEETGYKCHIQPVMMLTRAPLPDDLENMPHTVRSVSDLDEPFMFTDGEKKGTGEFRADFFEYEEALQKLTYQNDRKALEKAIALVKDSGLGCP
ncbi:hypothetical protein BDW74DRAFT_178550 [Aspergillus multicolor]|uniref:putative NUDIX domain n=1 Tax=Aspergillus multicolor TaxID=41759 RepID=UPI003CCD4A81